MPKINRLIFISILLILILSLFYINKNDEIYSCLLIGVENDSVIFFIPVQDNENNISVKEYIINGNDYSNAIKKAKENGIIINIACIKAICYSNDLNIDNMRKFNSYAKNIIDVSCFVYSCNIDDLLNKDDFDTEGVFVLSELNNQIDDTVLFIDVLYNRKQPLKIIYDNNKFVKAQK